MVHMQHTYVYVCVAVQLTRVGARVGAGVGAGVGALVGTGVGAGVGAFATRSRQCQHKISHAEN
jgi:hypothetical protein